MRAARLCLVILLLALSWPLPGRAVQAASPPAENANSNAGAEGISAVWPQNIQRWSTHISALAHVYGLDPDFIAAVIQAESNGMTDVVSYQGAVGLMGIMPYGPGLEWRPSPEELENPGVNLRWGVSILSTVVQQAGGDLHTALAAYVGGWDQVESREAREYAADVLHQYGRAVAERNGLSPDLAPQWTIAIEVKRGNIPLEPLIVLGGTPVSGLLLVGQHEVYDYVDETGRAFYMRGYAVPLALAGPMPEAQTAFGPADQLEPELTHLWGDSDVKISSGNPRVLLACLPTLSRLRGRISTRWFAPSSCPSWHR